MGASAWSYVVPFESDVRGAFEKLQQKLLKKEHGGRPLAKVQRAAGEDGLHSILDMTRVSDEPAPPRVDFATMFANGATGQLMVTEDAMASMMRSLGTVFRMTDDELTSAFGTARPTRAAAESFGFDLRFIERGTGRYAVLYVDDAPMWLWFVGISGD